MEELSYINIISTSENLRLYILEHTLHLEEMVSSSLGIILNLDWKKSKSFGFGSTALSFNQKVQIIQDFKELDKEDIKKMTDLMIIRNKFAHVKSVETFKDFFEIGTSSISVKKNLDKWYGNETKKIEKDEFKYKVCFFHLFWDIAQMLLNKIVKHAFEEGKKVGRNNYLNALKDEIMKMPGGNVIMENALENVKKQNLNI